MSREGASAQRFSYAANADFDSGLTMTGAATRFRTVMLDHPDLLQFCKSINEKSQPQYVQAGIGIGPFGLCYWNVTVMTEKYGGKMVVGWQLFEWPGLLLSAMHHAVWESPAGELFDVTSKPPMDTVNGRSTFLPDDSIEVDPRRVGHIQNRNLVLRDIPETGKFIEAYNRKNDIEKSIADIYYKCGYKAELQFAQASGCNPEPFNLNIDGAINLKLSRLSYDLNRAKMSFEDAIIRLLKADDLLACKPS